MPADIRLPPDTEEVEVHRGGRRIVLQPVLAEEWPQAMADDVLRAKGMEVLEANLGPVEALRFLALLSREPFDYQSWRDKHFQGMSLTEILARAAQTFR